MDKVEIGGKYQVFKPSNVDDPPTWTKEMDCFNGTTVTIKAPWLDYGPTGYSYWVYECGFVFNRTWMRTTAKAGDQLKLRKCNQDKDWNKSLAGMVGKLVTIKGECAGGKWLAVEETNIAIKPEWLSTV